MLGVCISPSWSLYNRRCLYTTVTVFIEPSLVFIQPSLSSYICHCLYRTITVFIQPSWFLHNYHCLYRTITGLYTTVVVLIQPSQSLFKQHGDDRGSTDMVFIQPSWFLCNRLSLYSTEVVFIQQSLSLPTIVVFIIIIMYIYHALINALSAHMIHINLNMIFYTHVKHSPTKTIYTHTNRPKGIPLCESIQAAR